MIAVYYLQCWRLMLLWPNRLGKLTCEKVGENVCGCDFYYLPTNCLEDIFAGSDGCWQAAR